MFPHCKVCLRPTTIAEDALSGQSISLVWPASWVGAAPGEWFVWEVGATVRCVKRNALRNLGLAVERYRWMADPHTCPSPAVVRDVLGLR